MAELTDPIRRVIVEAHARYQTLAEIVALIRAEFDLELTMRQVGSYDPNRSYYEAGERWLPIFESAREAYRKGLDRVPMSDQAFRLNEIHLLYAKAKQSGNLVLAANLLEQAAKEVGGVLTNERNMKVETTKGSYKDLEPEERRSMVADMFAGLGLNGNAPGSEKAQ